MNYKHKLKKKGVDFHTDSDKSWREAIDSVSDSDSSRERQVNVNEINKEIEDRVGRHKSEN